MQPRHLGGRERQVSCELEISLRVSLSESAMSELCKLSGVHRSELNSEAAKRQPFRNLKGFKEEHTAKTVEKNVAWVCGWMELLPALAWPRGMPL